MAQVWARPLCECGGVVARHHRLDGGRIPTGLTSGGGDGIGHEAINHGGKAVGAAGPGGAGSSPVQYAPTR